MTHSMRSIFDSPLLVFSEAFQPCILASTSMARILSDALIFHRSNLALAMLISFSVAHAKFASISLAVFLSQAFEPQVDRIFRTALVSVHVSAHWRRMSLRFAARVARQLRGLHRCDTQRQSLGKLFQQAVTAASHLNRV